MAGFPVNLMLVVVIIAMIVKMLSGYRNGMVKEMISMVSMVVLCVVAALVAYGVNSYHDGKVFNVAVAVVLLMLVMTAHHFLSLAFFSAKLFSKLPVVHTLDKLLGIVFGALEIVFLLWMVYAFAMMMDMGAIGQRLLGDTEGNPVLSWFYRHNYLARWIGGFLDGFDYVPLMELLLRK